MRSHATRLRARFLAAMGLPVVASATLVACGPPRLAPEVSQIEVLPDDALRRYPLAEGAWSVGYRDPPKGDVMSCPDGNFCVVGRRKGAEGRAAAPFDRCAEKVPYPHDPPAKDKGPGGPAWVGGPDVNERHAHDEIRFDERWTTHEQQAKDPGACCYYWFEPCPGGRPLRDPGGDAVVAPIVAGDQGWHAALAEPHPRDEARARRWLRAAQFEHASVASFARFVVELLALGAPAELVERAQQAALDEIAHARLAFALAAAFAGEARGPGSLPGAAQPAVVTPEAVARATFRDGCVAETIAALEARRDLADACSDDERAALAQIAEDEERHAELAFAALAWLVATFGAPVRVALAEELARLERSARCEREAPEETVVAPCVRALLAA